MLPTDLSHPYLTPHLTSYVILHLTPYLTPSPSHLPPLLPTDLSLLPAVCESLRALLYPLKWTHVFLPVVPAPLLDLVQAPVPYLLGTHTNWLHLIPWESLQVSKVVSLRIGTFSCYTSLSLPSHHLSHTLLSHIPL